MKFFFLLSIFFTILFFNFIYAQSSQNFTNCKGSINNYEIADSNLVYIRSVKNAILYQAGGEYVDPKINVVHLFGTPYEQGFAQGTILKNEMLNFFAEVEQWIEVQIKDYVPFLPEKFVKVLAENGTIGVLDLTYDLTKPYTPQHFIDEAQGIADALEIPFNIVMGLNLLPELVQAHCSMVGSWQDSSAKDYDLLQLRALDWDMDGPFQKYPMVSVYHPPVANGDVDNTNDYGHPFVNIAWIGFIGSLSGYSGKTGICEKVWLHYEGHQSRSGYPWNFLLRDILQFDQDIDNALSRIASAKRTCSIFVGVGDSESNTFRAVEYAHDYVNFYNDQDYPEYPNHPRMKDLVYIDKHSQPSHDPCFTELLQYYYGEITPQAFIKYITSQFQTGDTHCNVYDFKNNFIYVSNAGVYNPTTKYAQPAYDRQFTKFNVTQLFMEPLPKL